MDGLRSGPGATARRWDGDSDHRGRPDGATVRNGANDYHRERRDWPGDARPEDLASRPRLERRERDGQRCYAHEEEDRERYTQRARHEYGHAESHWREPAQGRRRDGDWEHLQGDLESRRGGGAVIGA
jgi:hypothetical protein